MTSSGRQRLVWIGLFALWSLLLARAFQVQVMERSFWTAKAVARQGQIHRASAERGEIVSADGVILARSVTNRSLSVDPSRVEDPTALGRALAGIGAVDPAGFVRTVRANPERRFLWIDRGLLPDQQVLDLLHRFPCLSAILESKRLYPLGTAGGSLVGVVGQDEDGLGGLEAAYDADLEGVDGKILEVSDRTGTLFPGLERQLLQPPRPGRSLVLTLHSKMQEIAAAHLAAVVREQRAAGGFVIVTRPATGEVLAMASMPCPDPTDPSSWKDETLRIRSVTDAFEPGSVYKIVTFAAALESGRITTEDPIDCMNGVRIVAGGHAIRDHEKFGILPAWGVLAHSSNIGTGVIAERVGAEGFYRMEKSLGFGLPTGVGLPGEGRGRIPDPSAWSKRSLVTQAFGQEISCTGIQLAMAYGAVANGGYLMRPLLVREVRSADGSRVERHGPETIRQVMRPVVARTLALLLRGVVEQGTGVRAEIPGYPPAGKTGTAQKYVRELGGYSREHYVASFVGFAPWDDPEVLCLVVLDEPKGDIYGGNVAAPAFASIVSDLRPFLSPGSPSAPILLEEPRAGREPDPGREVPSVEGLSAQIARRVVIEAGFLPRFQGPGGWVKQSHPPAGEHLLEGGVVTLELSAPHTGGRDRLPMPDLVGLSLRDALLRVRSFQGVPRVEGAGWVLSQKPPPGSEVGVGAQCWIKLGPDSCRAWKEYQDVAERASRDLAAGALLGESPAEE